MTSSNSEAIAIPEILQNVFLHLDRPSLHVCARVSRLWRSWSLHVAWLVYSIPRQDAADFLAQRCVETNIINGASEKDQGTDSEGCPLTQSKKPSIVREFKKQCYRIQSLTVGSDSHSEMALWSDCNNVFSNLACALPTSLINLIHLRFGLCCLAHAPTDLTIFSDIITGLISQNPNLQHLVFFSHQQPSYRVLFTALRNNPLQQLRRLDLCCDLNINGFSHLLDLLAMRSKFEHLEQDHGRASELTTAGWDLEELIIRSSGSSSFEQFVWDSRNSTTPPRPVAVQKLTLFDFCLAVYVDEQGEDEDGDESERLQINWSVLYHLCRRFPVLKRLQLSSDIPIDYKPSSVNFENYIYDSLRDLDEFESDVFWHPEQLAMAMIKACPKLTEIDLSHHRELHPEDWDLLLQHYASQLESLSAWSVDQLRPQELVRLVPPSPMFIGQFGGHPSQKWIGLQELDISANSSIAPAIHMFFKFVPTLRHFKALGVPVKAHQLLGFDWVCTSVETLAVNILIPTQAWPEREIWRWDVAKDRWRMIGDDEDDHEYVYLGMDTELPFPQILQESGNGGRQEDSSSDSDSNSDVASDTDSETDSSSDSDTSESESESDTDSSSDSEGNSDESPASTSAELESKGAPNEAKSMKRLTHSMQIQTAICQQLGRLTRLKELTLEGREEYRYDNREWDCLHLTLKTGLDYLRPLQANLQKLVVFQLDEELCGQEEVEWIAQNWVHQDNRVWQDAFEARSGSSLMPPRSMDNPAATLGGEGTTPVLLCPQFRELCGVSVCGKQQVSALEANMNVAWLEAQCPHLTVEKDVTGNREVFFSGQYQDY
ncbi:hypothetical protein BGZ96_006670 [Linnemannia gamsii]|uniref:F-box domain-containing protein n=1 Tax=Linnemannia gamsii TaxID=64522 RepID=A0ABQ7K2Q9_9FUNG|nr:hypothetical protein BGZ96_006670 [Linnemannia gamsii]